jgi:hypothetical protein
MRGVSALSAASPGPQNPAVNATATHAAPPGKTSLQHFEPLLLAEAVVLRAAALGEIAKVGYRRPRSPAPDVRLRAEFLKFMALGGGAGAPVGGRRLQIMGACVIGRLDLAGTTLPLSLWLYRCSFGSEPCFDGARVRGSLTFSDCALPALHATGCRIDADLALNAGCLIEGELLLARSVIGGDLNGERLRLRGTVQAGGAPRRMFVADGVVVRGDIRLHGGIEVAGTTSLVGARIGGDLLLGGARLTADIDSNGARGVALDLDRARVAGRVALDAGFSAAGAVRLLGARIGGDLDCTEAEFDAVGDAGWGEHGSALRLDRARIGGALMLRRLQGALQGASLVDAQAGELADDAETWGQHHTLDGFRYARFSADAPTDAATRLAWLTRQQAAEFSLAQQHRPDSWRRAIGVLRRMGHAASANDLAIGREQHLRTAGLIGRDAHYGLRGVVRLAHAGYGFLAGYGHRPVRLVVGAIGLWFACAAVYHLAADGFAPNPTLLAAAPKLTACRPACAQAPLTLPEFAPLLYSLDVLLPLADLQQARHWAPVRQPASVTSAWLGLPPLRLLTALESACGWLLLLTGLLALFGLTDRDRAAR